MHDVLSGPEAQALYNSEYWRVFKLQFWADITTQTAQDWVRNFWQNDSPAALSGLDNDFRHPFDINTTAYIMIMFKVATGDHW